MQIYVVKAGDSIDGIASAYSLSPSAIAYVNQIPPPFSLTIGQSLLLPTDEIASNEKRSVHSGGYAYPFITRWVLEQTLPYLSDLFIFSYGFTAEGQLIPPILNEQWMISLAKAYQTAPILTLTPFGPDGNFNNSLISSVVNNLSARTTLKNNIIARIQAYGYEGLDIDFEYILASDKQAFSDFVNYMAEAVHGIGYPLSVALAPKTSANQAGLLYEGKDYAQLGAAADYVLLMTYEWGYKYGPPMAVAPINKVREVLDYAITVIPPEKIHLGLPNYGYDWTLPFEQGISAATTIGNVEAVQIAVLNGSVIIFDETAQSPYFNYETLELQPQSHLVWFEDVRSYGAKFNLLNEYNLRGLSCWQINQLFLAGWLLLNDRFLLKND